MVRRLAPFLGGFSPQPERNPPQRALTLVGRLCRIARMILDRYRIPRKPLAAILCLLGLAAVIALAACRGEPAIPSIEATPGSEAVAIRPALTPSIEPRPAMFRVPRQRRYGSLRCPPRPAQPQGPGQRPLRLCHRPPHRHQRLRLLLGQRRRPRQPPMLRLHRPQPGSLGPPQ